MPFIGVLLWSSPGSVCCCSDIYRVSCCCVFFFCALWTMAAPASSGPSVPVLYVRRLSDHACLPERSSPLAAGFDLVSATDLVIPANGKALVKTDIALALPPGCYGRIAPRSGLAWKSHIGIGAGVIDADYRGNVGVVMFNLSSKTFELPARWVTAGCVCACCRSSGGLARG